MPIPSLNSADEADMSQLAWEMSQARQGNAVEVTRLFTRCRSYLRMMARCQIGRCVRGKVEESDLVQITMLEAYRGWKEFRGRTPAELLAWLRKLLSHNAIDLFRHYQQTGKRQASREIQGLPSSDKKLQDSLTPSQYLMKEEMELQLADAITRLPPDYQEVILLRSLQRLSFDEIAERMQRSKRACQMLWTRAIKHLQQDYQTLENSALGS